MSPSRLDSAKFDKLLRELIEDLIVVADGRRFSPDAWVRELLANPLTLPGVFNALPLAQHFRDQFDAIAALIPDDDASRRSALGKARAIARESVESSAYYRGFEADVPRTSRGQKSTKNGGERSTGEQLASPRPASQKSLGRKSSGRKATRGGLLGAEEDVPPPPMPPPPPPPPPDAMVPPPRSAPPPPSPSPPSMTPGLESRAPDAAPPPPERRFIEAGIMGHDGKSPLELDTEYILEFGVVVEKKKAKLAHASLPSSELLFKEHEETIELTVQVDSSDFEIAQKSMTLVLPRRGPSLGKARFDVRALHGGDCVIVATFHKQGNFIEQMELTLSVGAAESAHSSQTSGRNLDNATMLQPRDVGISVAPAAGGGYDFVIWGAVQARVRLPITESNLTQAVVNARTKLMSVVTQKGSDGGYVFQTGVDIPPDDATKALDTMRDAGARLFQQLFFSADAGPDVQRVGEWLQQQATTKNSRLKLQVVARNFPVPWPLLYVGPDDGPADWEGFLGMRHIIEQIPLQPDLLVPNPDIASDSPSLSVSVTANSGIDVQMGGDFVQRQRDYWAETADSLGLRVVQRERGEELIAALSGAADDQLMYLYCHAITSGIGDVNGIDSSCFVLTGEERVTLGQLNKSASMKKKLPGNPLVIINACESAELSPMFYDGFVPYFMAKGARGVVGTECKTPALFATEWALRFFPMFLGGASVGDAMLATRRDCWTEWNNPLGLLYAVHCNTDTRVAPGLAT